MRTRRLARLLVFAAVAACGDDGGGGPGPIVPVEAEPAELAGITAAHDAVRAAHGVAPLAWDPVLAGIAQAWADACVDEEFPPGLIDHNPNRSDSYTTYVGENIFGQSGAAPTGQAVVDLWASEEANYDYASNTCAEGEMCGHYTQVVWAGTTHVGCALGHCPGLTYEYVVVCNYGPGGNDGGRPY